VRQHAENELVAFLAHERALLGHLRRDQNLHQALGAKAFLGAIAFQIHASISSNLATAPRVNSVFSNLSRVSGSAFFGSITSTLGRLREDKYRFSSTLSVITRTLVSPKSLSFWASNLVL